MAVFSQGPHLWCFPLLPPPPPLYLPTEIILPSHPSSSLGVRTGFFLIHGNESKHFFPEPRSPLPPRHRFQPGCVGIAPLFHAGCSSHRPEFFFFFRLWLFPSPSSSTAPPSPSLSLLFHWRCAKTPQTQVRAHPPIYFTSVSNLNSVAVPFFFHGPGYLREGLQSLHSVPPADFYSHSLGTSFSSPSEQSPSDFHLKLLLFHFLFRLTHSLR